MKKLVLIYSFVLGIALSVNAQVRQANGTSINVATNSSAFFDASSTPSWNSSANVGKGFLYPRVRLSLFTSFSTSGTVGIANNYPGYFDGFVVYNTDTVGVAGIGATQGGALTRGFWYYENKTTSVSGGTWKLVGTSQVEIVNTIANNGKALTGNGIIVTGGDSAVLKATSLRLDSSVIAKLIGQSPVKDSVIKTVTSSTMFRDSISSVITQGLITGKNVTAGNLVTLTGTPAGASLKDFGISVDTTAMKTFISNSVTNNTITGQNTTGGSLVTVTNGSGASLKAMTVAVNTAALKDSMSVYVTQSPIKDSIGSAVTNIINNNAITGKNVTAGSLVTLTGTPAGASLKDFGISVDTTAMKTFITNNAKAVLAKNGLTRTVDTIELGGALTKATTVTTSAANTLALAGLQSGAAGDSIVVANATTGVLARRSPAAFVASATTNTLTGTGSAISSTVNGVVSTLTPAAGTIASGNTLGFDASGNLVKGLGNSPDSTTSSNGLTMTGKDVRLGGALTAATTVTTTAANTLALAGLQSGAASDSILVANPTTGVIARRSASGLAIEPWFNTLTNSSAKNNTDSIYIMGKVGIGTTTPSEMLEVRGNAFVSGEVYVGSDARLKKNILELSNALKVLAALRPVSYNKQTSIGKGDFKENKEYGFLAQEVARVLPDIVKVSNDKDNTMSVNYTSLIPLLTQAIQDQQKELEKKDIEIQYLKDGLNAVMKKLGIK